MTLATEKPKVEIVTTAIVYSAPSASNRRYFNIYYAAKIEAGGRVCKKYNTPFDYENWEANVGKKYFNIYLDEPEQFVRLRKELYPEVLAEYKAARDKYNINNKGSQK